MNVITLTGNAVKDIEIKITGNGKTIANGTIAVKRDFKNPSGEYETDFIDFIALGKTGEIMGNYIKKGDKFGITGRLQIRKWTKDDGNNASQQKQQKQQQQKPTLDLRGSKRTRKSRGIMAKGLGLPRHSRNDPN